MLGASKRGTQSQPIAPSGATSAPPDIDLAPVVNVSINYNVLVVNPAVPAKSVAELIALLKKEPDKFTFSSGGFGTPAHLMGEMFKLQTGVSATHVPYQQFPQAIGHL